MFRFTNLIRRCAIPVISPQQFYPTTTQQTLVSVVAPISFKLVRYFSTDKIIANENIRHETVRLVFEDEQGVTQHKVLKRLEAIEFAKSKSTDLILVSPDANPPVCKLQNLKKFISDTARKERVVARNTRVMKEMHLTTAIEPHDLKTKVNKIKAFLQDKHQVKVVIQFKPPTTIHKKPVTIDEILVSILTTLEHYVSNVNQLSAVVRTKRELILSPSSKPIPKTANTELPK